MIVKTNLVMRKFYDMKSSGSHCLMKCEIGTHIAVFFADNRPVAGFFKGIVDNKVPQILLQRDDDFGQEPGLVSIPVKEIRGWARVYPIKPINASVYPSMEQTISVAEDPVYGGAHNYLIRDCLGYIDGQTRYDDEEGFEHSIRFVRKNDDGTIVPGLQSEQLVLVLLDRHEKLNARFPSEQNAKMIAGLRMFLEACEERVKNRIERGVMGELKK